MILGIAIISIAIALGSCAPSFSSKHISIKDIVFSNVQKPDFIIIDNLSAELTATFDSKANIKPSSNGSFNVGMINDLYLEEDQTD